MRFTSCDLSLTSSLDLMLTFRSFVVSVVTVLVLRRNDVYGSQTPLNSATPNIWLEKYGKQIDQPFSGPLAFSHLGYTRCLEDASAQFNIAVLGMPFDTGTSYRPGARFGPYGIRSGSRRQRESRGWSFTWQTNPYALGSKIIDCGDVRFFSTKNIATRFEY